MLKEGQSFEKDRLAIALQKGGLVGSLDRACSLLPGSPGLFWHFYPRLGSQGSGLCSGSGDRPIRVAFFAFTFIAIGVNTRFSRFNGQAVYGRIGTYQVITSSLSACIVFARIAGREAAKLGVT